MRTKIQIKYGNGLCIERGKSDNKNIAHALNAEMMRLGYIASEKLIDALSTLSTPALHKTYNDLISVLKEFKGDNVVWEPMYPNFPTQVKNMSNLELYLNAMTHYWSLGTWKPEYDKVAREFGFESTKFITIDLLDYVFDYLYIFKQILSSNDSISESDKVVLEWFLDNESSLAFPPTIPFKENLCFIASRLIERGEDISHLVKTSTDVLRIITALNDGDISLAANTKFMSMTRQHRRMFCHILEGCANIEDLARHKSKWIALSHNLHVGDYSDQLYTMFGKLRNNEFIQTWAGKLQEQIDNGNVVGAVEMLIDRPGDFARRVDHLLRIAIPKRKAPYVVTKFLEVADQVASRNLLQLYGNLKIRKEDVDTKVVFPKGSLAKAVVLRALIPKLPVATVNKLSKGIEAVLMAKYSMLDQLGKVYIDPQLKNCPLPTQQRSASESLFQVARGTRLPIGDDTTLRFFVYWKGEDIDLSATFHNTRYTEISHVSYTNLRDQKLKTYHSGDIIHAPNGAVEFIDIDIDAAMKAGAKYVAMNLFVYNGPNFSEHEICYVGWMTRSQPNSNEIFDPKTVIQKIDLRGETKNCIPVFFDLVERKAVWVDLATKRSGHFGGNNVQSNRATIEETLEAIIESRNKATLHELFTLHAKSRGKIVTDREKADIIFSIDEGITPYNITEINAEFVV